jgi:cysteine desulfurase
MTQLIYLDNNASTALAPAVRAAMTPWLDHTGNAASSHAAGQAADRAISCAREQVADLLTAAPREIVFTSGATEANNLAIRGLTTHSPRRTLVCGATEHPSVLEPMRALERDGYTLRIAPVDEEGLLRLDALAELVDDDTMLVSVMAANNETGVVSPIREAADLAHAAGALLHTDATQLAGWGPLSVDTLGADLLSLSAHKMHGPQGVGALFIRRGLRLTPLLHGGGHERGVRSGTPNTMGIVGLGAAAAAAAACTDADRAQVRRRRDLLAALLDELAGPVRLNGHATQRLPGTLNVTFPGVDADLVMAGAPTVAVATGSACSSGHPGPSHVLGVMGIDPALAAASLRFGLSRYTSDSEVHEAAERIATAVQHARASEGRAS